MKLAQTSGLQFDQTRSNAVILYDTLPAEKRCAWRPRISFIERNAWFKDRVLFLTLIRNVVHMCSTISTCARSNKIILGIETTCGELRGNPKQHCSHWILGFFDLNSESAGCMATKSQSWSRYSRDITRNNSFNDMNTSTRSTTSAKTIITRRHEPHRDLSTLRELRKISMSWLQCLLRHRDSFIAVAGENSTYSRSPTHSRRPFTSIPGFVFKKQSSRRQNMVSLKDKWGSTGRSRCLRKEDKVNMATIQRIFQSGTTKKNTKRHWRSTKLPNTEVMLFDRIVLKRHDFSATRAERQHERQTLDSSCERWWSQKKKSLFDSDRNLPLLKKKIPHNARRSLGGNEAIS